MTICIACFTWNGANLAKRLSEKLSSAGENVHVAAAPRIAEDVSLPSTEGIAKWTADVFPSADALIYIGAAGIAVRAIAPHIVSKHTDPAVLCLDERGMFVIPLLSGHEGGANQLARRIAAITGGSAVLTTATDVNRCFAVDEWIARMGFALIHPENVGALAIAELHGDAVGLQSEFPVRGNVPKEFSATGAAGLYIGIHERDPFERTVQAVPRVVTAGIGCRKATSQTVICDAIHTAFDMETLSIKALKQIATIDLKKHEGGLLSTAEEYNVPLRFFSAQELAQAEGEFTSSERVKRITGVDNVCERAAVLASKGALIMKKHVFSGVTVALAVNNIAISFPEDHQCD